MRIRRRLPAIAILLLAACRGDSRSASSARATTLVMTLPADADNFLPPLTLNETSVQVGSVLFEKLAEVGDSLQVVGDIGFRPSLADSWTWAPDSLSIAFHLDPKAHWHDGVPVRAADVVYSYRVNTSKDVGSTIEPLLADIDSVTARDSLTPVFWFHARSLEQFFNAATQIRVLPAHLLQNIPDSALKTAPFGRNPVGSGPFKFVRWVSGSSIEVDADSTFHRGRPKLDRIIWSIAGNPDAAMLRLYSGEANFTEMLRKQDIELIARHAELKTVRYPSMTTYFARFNERARGGHGPHPVFADRDVRRALTMAIDRRRAVSTVLDSATRVALGPFTSTLSTYDSTLPRLAYAPDSAAAILQRRGWVMGPDGIRHKGATKLQFSILVPVTSTQRQQMSVLLQDMLKRVGARMDIERVDFPTMGSRMQAHDYDMTFEGMSLDPTPSGIRQEWSISAAQGEGASNTGYYSDPAFDAVVDSAVSSMDSKVAIAQYRRAYATLIADAPAIWLYEGASVAGMRADVHPAPMRGDLWFVHLADWTIGNGPAPKSASVALAAGAH
ncbi:MAG: peptide ABC transporter substrate-binding protein [Gemmatimonadaceae bacterium]|nr:peptide ABC transporter substrate-binding protein [Gemmatimonadaceae bacterium]